MKYYDKYYLKYLSLSNFTLFELNKECNIEIINHNFYL